MYVELHANDKDISKLTPNTNIELEVNSFANFLQSAMKAFQLYRSCH